ncbi:MAG: hypothetical protein ACE15C_19250 [Phycisphaerae bacterium]
MARQLNHNRALKAKVRKILKDNLPGINIDDLGPGGLSGKIGGVLVWKQFEGLDQVDRQEKVWNLLRQHLSMDEQSRLSLMITLTPDELKSIRAA